jgi:hypothetical protein
MALDVKGIEQCHVVWLAPDKSHPLFSGLRLGAI